MTENLETLFEQFIHECRFAKRRRPETIRGYRAAFDTFGKLVPNLTAESLTPFVFSQFCECLQKRIRTVGNGTTRQGVKDSTIASYQCKLSTFFGWMVRNGHLKRNPLDLIPRVKPKYENVNILRKFEIDKIRTAVENNGQSLFQKKRDRAIISVLLFCGLRKGELLGLKVIDLDMERRIMTVRSETSKSKLPRKIPMTDEVYMYLVDYLDQKDKKKFYTTPSLFVSLFRDRGLSAIGLNHWVNRLRQLSGVRFHLHQFRHTFASNLAAQGINSVQLQKLMGHSDLRMLQTYVRSLNADDLRPALSNLTFENLA